MFSVFCKNLQTSVGHMFIKCHSDFSDEIPAKHPSSDPDGQGSDWKSANSSRRA